MKKSVYEMVNTHWKSIALALVILFAGVAIKSILVKTAPQPPAKSLTERAWPVKDYQVTGDIKPMTIPLYGKVEAPVNPTLTAPITAYVAATPFLAGQSFERGDQLLKLDLSDIDRVLRQRQAEVTEIQSSLEEAKKLLPLTKRSVEGQQEVVDLSRASLDREQALQSKQLTSATRLDAAKQTYQREKLSLEQQQQSFVRQQSQLQQLSARLEKAQSALEQATEDRKRAQMIATYSGSIVALNVSAGERITPGQPIMQIFANDSVEIKAQIPNRYAAWIHQLLSQQHPLQAWVKNSTSAIPLKRLSSSLAQGKAGIDAYFGRPDQWLPLGQTISLMLELPNPEEWLSIPRQAIFDQSRVYVIKEQRLRPVAVTIHGSTFSVDGAPMALVSSQTKLVGQRILATQLPSAIEGLLVKPLNKEGVTP